MKILVLVVPVALLFLFLPPYNYLPLNVSGGSALRAYLIVNSLPSLAV